MFDGLSCGAGWNLGSSECAVFLFGIEQGSGSIAVAAVGMWKSGLWAISKGGGKRVKTWFWFSSLSTARHFHGRLRGQVR